MQMAANIIDDNNTSQPIAASESRLTTQSAYWSWAKVNFCWWYGVRFNWQLEITGVQYTANLTGVAETRP